MSHLVIDGYNVLMGTPRYARIVERDLDAARASLTADLGAMAADRRVTVVFDGGSNPQSDGVPRDIGGVSVVFSPYGVDADSVIEQMAAEARASGEPTEIVTSDSATRWTSVGGPVYITRSSAFALELDAAEKSWQDSTVTHRRRSTVGERVSDAVRSELDRMSGRADPRS